MSFSKTLGFYFARTYFVRLVFLLVGLMGLIYFFDVVELIRRASKFDNVPLTLVLQMGLFKLPEVTQVLLPFAVLFGAILTFWGMTQKLELVVVRSAGFSPFQFLAPVLCVAVCVGFFQMLVFNPLGAYLIDHYERLENIHLRRQTSEIALFQDGLWLRQDTDDGHLIVHSEKIKQPEWELVNVSGFFFDQENGFLERFDAPSGFLKEGFWAFRDTALHRLGGQREIVQSFEVPTHLTRKDVEESFAAPEAIAFWNLPSHIRILEDSGFDASKLKVHFHTLLAQPLMFAAMILIAAGVSMRLPRSGAGFLFIAAGVFVGLVVFFLSSFMQALGASQQVPLAVAAWSPAVLTFFTGLTVVFNQEES